ncbi:glycogen debranching protein [Singulisphaera sp. PoT]|uniref:glycogen debranching protein n=1 Tax=Singulisphaera sp. PoT TaxID=3411797 RepID=UPI003BF5BFE6
MPDARPNPSPATAKSPQNGDESFATQASGRSVASSSEPGPYAFGNKPISIVRGNPLPLGASLTPHGVNFSLVCRHGTSVSLVLSEPCSGEIEAEVPLDPRNHRTGDHWHVQVDGLPNEFCYGYRVDGPKGNGNCYDPSHILLNPISHSLSCGRPWGDPSKQPRRSLLNRSMMDLQGDSHPGIPREDSIIYELHVRGFTVDPSSGVHRPGTFAGLIEKIPYLKDLGITAVELMPIDEFDENDCPYVNPYTGERLKNFWGYNPITYAAPKAAYSSNPERSQPWDEFRQMVRAFHNAGIEVILDIVMNHTAESGENGPTYSFRGLDNSLYYILNERGEYLNFSGCGNSVNSNHPIVRELLLSCLRNWLAEGGVDGFRFDLASVLGRDRRGNLMIQPPVIEQISEDSLLSGAKLIAEPWDLGTYQLGHFPGGARWSAWNNRFRDEVRRFWRGDPGMTPDLASRVCGSEDIFPGMSPLMSLNFITCHDGFTLCDVVSYNEKHNEANGESNRDGVNDNYSWNCGVEGPTKDPEILALRSRQARNLIATLLVSQGVPMLLGGDELLRTQNGNNNAWCQDNATGWVDWSLAETNEGFLRFVRQLIALRRNHPALRRKTFFNGAKFGRLPDISWHGVEPCQPDFSHNSHALAFALDGRRVDRPGVIDRDFYFAFNAYWEPLIFRIPASPTGRIWHRVVDTSLPSPEDAMEPDQGPNIPVLHPYKVEARSLVILVSEA